MIFFSSPTTNWHRITWILVHLAHFINRRNHECTATSSHQATASPHTAAMHSHIKSLHTIVAIYSHTKSLLHCSHATPVSSRPHIAAMHTYIKSPLHCSLAHPHKIIYTLQPWTAISSHTYTAAIHSHIKSLHIGVIHCHIKSPYTAATPAPKHPTHCSQTQPHQVSHTLQSYTATSSQPHWTSMGLLPDT